MRSAYPLSADPDTAARWPRWPHRGVCFDQPDMWVGNNLRRGAAQRAEYVAHICLRHCPVLAECRRDYRDLPRDHRRGVVIAGQIYNADGDPGPKGKWTRPGCPTCLAERVVRGWAVSGEH